jgi:hypothetical protein
MGTEGGRRALAQRHGMNRLALLTTVVNEPQRQLGDIGRDPPRLVLRGYCITQNWEN